MWLGPRTLGSRMRRDSKNTKGTRQQRTVLYNVVDHSLTLAQIRVSPIEHHDRNQQRSFCRTAVSARSPVAILHGGPSEIPEGLSRVRLGASAEPCDGMGASGHGAATRVRDLLQA